MQNIYFHVLFLIATFLGAAGILIIILSRNTATRASKMLILMFVLIFGYLISHGIHFLLMYNKDVTVLDDSCHSFLLLIMVTLTFFTMNFPKSRRITAAETSVIIIPSVVLLALLWTGNLIGESHSHHGMFEAHYKGMYPLFLAWYAVLIISSIYITVLNILKEKNDQLRGQLKVFLFGVIITNLFSFTFGLFLPWLFGFYLLVEISPLAFLTGVILFTGISIGKYNMFPAAMSKIIHFSIKRKMFFSSLIIVPIIILIIQIPLGKILFGIESNVDLLRYFMLSLFGGIIVSISITFAILQIISTPLTKLKLQASEIEKGRLGIQFEYPSNDEIGELSTAFNHLSITLKNNATELESKENRINTLLNAFDKSSASIAIMSEELVLLEANNQFSELVETEMSSLAGKRLDELPFFDNPNVMTGLLLSASDGGRYNEEIPVKSRSGETVLLVSFSKVKSSNNTLGYLFVGLDISDKKRLEKQLIQSEKLAALGKMSAVLAHEIKTPLTSIKLNLEMLCETLPLSEEDASSFGIIKKELNRMNNLVNEVLQLSRTIDLNYSNVDVKELISNIIAEVQNKVRLKHVSIYNKVGPIEIKLDADKIRQVLLNMVDNAIEAVEKDGLIEFDSEIDGRNGIMRLLIKNNGNAIAEPDKIFEPFYTTKASGTGLGLSISQKIIEQHNGEIKLKISEDKNTVFEISLPLTRN